MVRAWETAKTRHGTPSGWRLHQELKERPCDACYQAKKEYDIRRKGQSEQTLRNRASARAQGKAYRELSQRYPEEYRELYEWFKEELS